MNRSAFIKLLFGGGIAALSPKILQAQLAEEEMGEYELNPVFVNSGPGFGHRIALTYDDGPTPGVTDLILKDLAKRNLHATFFMIGRKAAEYKSLAAEVAAAGHELANHTWSHPRLDRLSDAGVHAELQKCQDILAEISGKAPVWFRPPYGAFRKKQGCIPKSKDLGVTYWSVDPRDWARPGAARVIHTIDREVFPGAIILLHDLHPQTAQATPDVLDCLRGAAYNFATISGFLGYPYRKHGVANPVIVQQAATKKSA
jgi:peptidoglycan/xylan/chitin deacetylase (PgdA/CDA1 family)